VFKLRRGVAFHDGSEFDAAVAKWSLERQRDHPKAHLSKVPLANVAGVEVPDKYTLRLKLKSDSPSLIRLLAFAWGAKLRIISKAALDKLGEEGFARNPGKVKELLTAAGYPDGVSRDAWGRGRGRGGPWLRERWPRSRVPELLPVPDQPPGRLPDPPDPLPREPPGDVVRAEEVIQQIGRSLFSPPRFSVLAAPPIRRPLPECSPCPTRSLRTNVPYY
jgi:hypothetical protein